MNIKRIMIAAPKSGSGKTTITCALLQSLKNAGKKVASCKCGPDYIDPMFHEKVIGIPAKNLDTFFTGEEETRALFLKDRVEEELKVAVLGYYEEQKELHIESRNLGLQMPGELEDIKERLKLAAESLEKTVSVDEIVKLAEGAEDFEHRNETADFNRAVWDSTAAYGRKTPCGNKSELAEKRPVIAVAKDEAFCFYYEDNLKLLQEFGAKLHFFSPLHDKKLPKECAGLLIGGGYPELYVAELSQNKEMLSEIRKAYVDKMPIVAECGGFMYLHSKLTDKDGNSYRMAGVLPAECYDTGKLVRFGYIELKEKQCEFLPEGAIIKGHEFHYFDSTDNGSDALSEKPVTGKTYECVKKSENCWLGFPHLYYPSNPTFAKSFVEKAEAFMKREV